MEKVPWAGVSRQIRIQGLKHVGAHPGDLVSHAPRDVRSEEYIVHGVKRMPLLGRLGVGNVKQRAAARFFLKRADQVCFDHLSAAPGVDKRGVRAHA